MRKTDFGPEKQPDRCVLCGETTEYDKNTPVTERIGYIEGAGQLCSKCYKALYLKEGHGHG